MEDTMLKRITVLSQFKRKYIQPFRSYMYLHYSNKEKWRIAIYIWNNIMPSQCGHEKTIYKNIDNHEPFLKLVSGLTKLKFLCEILKMLNCIVFLKCANPF